LSLAVVLGVSSGFGAATARALAAEGWDIFGVHFDLRAGRARAEVLRQELESLGVQATFVNANAADDAKRADLIAQLPGTVGLLLHSIAFGSLKAIVGPDRLSERQVRMTTEVMGNSLLFWARDLADGGRMASGGRIFAMTSGGSIGARPGYGAVSAAKALLESHVRQLAVELAPRGITANAILAGATHTPAVERIPGWEDLLEASRSRNPHGRLTTPEDVAKCIVALSGSGTAWMTGNTIRVDGGETIAF